ncbi:MAG: hypothetical protein AVDCRST_MAG12-1796, partial [uncultured Rubrobacteraceae bacterium]
GPGGRQRKRYANAAPRPRLAGQEPLRRLGRKAALIRGNPQRGRHERGARGGAHERLRGPRGRRSGHGPAVRARGLQPWGPPTPPGAGRAELRGAHQRTRRRQTPRILRARGGARSPGRAYRARAAGPRLPPRTRAVRGGRALARKGPGPRRHRRARRRRGALVPEPLRRLRRGSARRARLPDAEEPGPRDHRRPPEGGDEPARGGVERVLV